jgi:hypothetical protein
VCAAIGATGILGGIAGLVTPIVLSVPGLAIVYGLVLGAHVLPGIIAQEVLRLPLVAVLTHVRRLVASAFAPIWTTRFLGTRCCSARSRRVWPPSPATARGGAWRFFISAAVIGVLVAVGLLRRAPERLPALGPDRLSRPVGVRTGGLDGDRTQRRRVAVEPESHGRSFAWQGSGQELGGEFRFD